MVGHESLKHLRFLLLCLVFSQNLLNADPHAPHQKATPFRIISADSVRHVQASLKFRGNVTLERDQARLSAVRMSYDQDTGRLMAWENISIETPDFVLLCNELIFETQDDELVAWGEPRIVQREFSELTGFEIELTGVQIRVYPREQRIRIFEDVMMTRFVVESGERRSVDLRVRCGSLDALSATRRMTFQGYVIIETPPVGARGERGLLNQSQGRFYLTGNVQAWNFDERGNPINVISGDEIVYVIDERRTMIVGNVTAQVTPQERATERSLPLRPDVVTRGDEGIDQ